MHTDAITDPLTAIEADATAEVLRLMQLRRLLQDTSLGWAWPAGVLDVVAVFDEEDRDNG